MAAACEADPCNPELHKWGPFQKAAFTKSGCGTFNQSALHFEKDPIHAALAFLYLIRSNVHFPSEIVFKTKPKD